MPRGRRAVTSPFESPPSLSELKPVKLPRATRRLKARLQEEGLLWAELSELEGADCGGEVRALITALGQKTGYRQSHRARNRLSRLVVWMHAEKWTDELAIVRQALKDGRLTMNGRGWWVWLCLYFDDKSARMAFAKVFGTWPEKHKRRFLTRLNWTSGEGKFQLKDLPNALANKAVRGDATLLTATKRLDLIAGTPLDRAVWARLLSLEAAPWVASHGWEELMAFLDRHRHGQPVGYVTRQLLEPLHRAGLETVDVSVQSRLGALVGALVERLPQSQNAPAWQVLSDRAREVIRWWSTQRDLEKFFNQWHADPEREAFWRGYVRHIKTVESYKKASALAMHIGDYWYVEFGQINNACWRYSELDWQRMERVRRSVTRPKDLKYDLGNDAHPWKAHSGGWQSKFPYWIGIHPDVVSRRSR
jgi:hypothetical protein